MIVAPQGPGVNWQPPSFPFILEAQEVHVWRGILDRAPADLQGFWNILDPQEQQRARRFVSSQHQDHFIAAHGLVRYILALYLNVPPDALAFHHGPQGKPFLTHPSRTGLCFNLSHTRHLALVAITLLGEIGVDLERHRPSMNFHAVAERIMGDEERMRFHDLPPGQQATAFFSCWTRKEAFVKAHGRGLGFPLHDVSVTFTPSETPRILTIKGHPDEPQYWSLYSFSPDSHSTAAVVVQGTPERISFWHFPDAGLLSP